MLENDAAMMKDRKALLPYLRKTNAAKRKWSDFCRSSHRGRGLLDSGFMRKYRLLKQSRELYSALFLLKNGRATK